MEYIYLEKTDSTNAYAKSNLSLLEDKTVIIARRQTSGHGRLSRKWIDLGGDNLFMTIVLRPSKVFVETYSSLTQYLSCVLCETLKSYGVDAQIKWPNDVQVGGKKISGILAETVMQGKTFNGLVLGIGVNLNAAPESFSDIQKPATALNIVLNKPIDIKEFSQKLIELFFLNYEVFLNEGFPFIRDEYIKRSNFLGKKLEIDIFGTMIEGIAKDLTAHGELILLCNNEKKIITIGDIL